ncbi:hypothetical protein [uncultured Thiocystis sp.]|jgi:hypothetical protein|uniref:hypothetical protein n=1 Tax=uncultured Thiocystis sp. TaxID=1202134 RepID=UPI0025CF78D0|nr:hypothetical protein [uncultured Thiocystis sp.]
MSEQPEKPGLTDYVKTYRKTQKPDAATLAGAAGSTAIAGTLGGVAAPSIAGWFGANIVTTSGLGTALSWLPAGLVNTLGIPAVATLTTPVGWVAGSIAVCATLGYGIFQLAHSGGRQDERRRVLGQSLRAKIQSLLHRRPPDIQQSASLTDQAARMAQVEALFRELGQEGAIAADKVAYFVDNLKSGRLPLADAVAILQEYGKELAHPTLDPTASNPDAALQQAASARALTVMHKGVTDDPDQPGNAFLEQMQKRFGIGRERALELYRDAPRDPDPGTTAKQLAELFDREVIQGAFAALEETSRSLQQGQAAFVRFLEVRQTLQAQFETQVAQIDQTGQQAWEAISRL